MTIGSSGISFTLCSGIAKSNKKPGWRKPVRLEVASAIGAFSCERYAPFRADLTIADAMPGTGPTKTYTNKNKRNKLENFPNCPVAGSRDGTMGQRLSMSADRISARRAKLCANGRS